MGMTPSTSPTMGDGAWRRRSLRGSMSRVRLPLDCPTCSLLRWMGVVISTPSIAGAVDVARSVSGARTSKDGSILAISEIGLWCGRRELNPHGLAACGFSYHFGFRRPARGGFVVWTIPSPFPVGFRCCPSSLYTFPEMLPGLARGCHFRFPRL
jgi:hypothetical protein